MATYKKRGSKSKKNVTLEQQSATAEVFSTLDEGASKTEKWVANNQKYIFIVIGLVSIVVLGSLGFKKFIQEPKEIEAKNDMFQAQKYFDEAVNGTDKDSLYTMSLNGGEGKFGMLDIISNYKGTDAGNLANYYAGMAYLHLKDYQNAVAHLDAFKADDEILGPLAKGGIGDAFAQLNQKEEALDYYEQALKMKTNNFTTPMFLYKAGYIALELGQYEKAHDYFVRIRDNYPLSSEASNINALVGKAEAAMK